MLTPTDSTPPATRDTLLAQGYCVIGFVAVDREYLVHPATLRLAHLQYGFADTPVIIQKTDPVEVLALQLAANRYLTPLDSGAFRRARAQILAWFPDYDME